MVKSQKLRFAGDLWAGIPLLGGGGGGIEDTPLLKSHGVVREEQRQLPGCLSPQSTPESEAQRGCLAFIPVTSRPFWNLLEQR